MAEKKKKDLSTQTSIIVFYILYFVWLTALTFISPDLQLLNYFSVGVVVFYFILLREKWDWLFFFLGTGFIVFMQISRWENWDIVMNYDKLLGIPLWLPLAWGTTAVALRKFYLIFSRKAEE